MERDRLSILRRVEKGEISVDEAKDELESITEVKKSPLEEAIEEIVPEKSYIPTRRERKLALAEKYQRWQTDMMITLREGDFPCQLPWPDKAWKWMWQNPEYPVYINHSMELVEKTKLQICSYYGDLFIRGWDQPKLIINGAVLDLRIGQDEDIVSIASSTGQLQICVPFFIKNIEARVISGDMWLSNIKSNIQADCESGDLGGEYINGDIRCQVNGGDVRLVNVIGAIEVNTIRGNTNLRKFQSQDVNVNSLDGHISIELGPVSSGSFRCENDKGEINILISDDISCELIAEVSKDGRLTPIVLPWNKLLERSQNRLHGILKDGGATIKLITQSGIIYIQESWVRW